MYVWRGPLTLLRVVVGLLTNDENYYVSPEPAKQFARAAVYPEAGGNSVHATAFT